MIFFYILMFLIKIITKFSKLYSELGKVHYMENICKMKLYIYGVLSKKKNLSLASKQHFNSSIYKAKMFFWIYVYVFDLNCCYNCVKSLMPYRGQIVVANRNLCLQYWNTVRPSVCTALRNHVWIVCKEMSSWTPLTMFLVLKTTF